MDIYTSTPFKDKKVRKGYILRFEQDNDNTKIDDVKIYVGFERYPAIAIFNVSELNKNFFLKSPNI